MYDGEDEYEGDPAALSPRVKNRERRTGRALGESPRDATRRGPIRAVRDGREAFKCVHCRAFIGPTVSGGKHRNHCPLCLHSKHVDGKRPGDRASACGAKMAPVGRFVRADGEPMIAHRCLGCGFVRSNRLAADDMMPVYDDLPIVLPPNGNEQ